MKGTKNEYEVISRIAFTSRLREAVERKGISDKELIAKLQEKGVGKGASQSAYTRYKDLSSEQYPTAEFLKAFCELCDVSADYLLGFDSAVESKKPTPYLILRNLLVLMKQIDFSVDFQNNASKVTLTTTNHGVIRFLFEIRNYTISQLANLDDSIIVEIAKNSFVVNRDILNEKEIKQLYLAEMMSIAEEYRTEAEDDLCEFKVKSNNDKATLCDMFEATWSSMTSEQKNDFIKSHQESNA